MLFNSHILVLGRIRIGTCCFPCHHVGFSWKWCLRFVCKDHDAIRALYHKGIKYSCCICIYYFLMLLNGLYDRERNSWNQLLEDMLYEECCPFNMLAQILPDRCSADSWTWEYVLELQLIFTTMKRYRYYSKEWEIWSLSN